MTTAEMLHPAGGGGWRKLPDGDMMNKICDNPHHKHPYKHEVRHLFVYKKQLMYDIESQVGMVAMSRRNESGVEDNTQSDMVSKYQPMLMRWLTKRFEKVKEALALAVIDDRQTASGDDLMDWDEKELVLQFPDWWDETAWKPLVDAVHSYLVNATMSEYYKITLTTKDPVTQSKLKDSYDDLGEVKTLLCKHHAGEIKRPLRPMGF